METKQHNGDIIYNSPSCVPLLSQIVKPVLRYRDKEQVFCKDKWPLKRGSINMKFSMTGQESVTLKYRWLFSRGDHMGKFDCNSISSSETTCRDHYQYYLRKKKNKNDIFSSKHKILIPFSFNENSATYMKSLSSLSRNIYIYINKQTNNFSH